MPRFTNDSGHDEKLIVVALFSEEICDAIDKFRHTAEGKTAFDGLISRNDLQTIKAEPDDTIYAHKVFNAALDSPLRNVLYNEVQRFLKIVDPKLHLVIENYTVYDRYLAHIPYLMRFVETTNLDELVSKCAGFKECLQPLQMSLAAKIIDNERFKKCFLRSVPEIGGAAVEHLFMHLFKYGSPEAKEFVELVNPNFDFERYYSWRHAAESSEQQPGAASWASEG
ncbi:hypothetical protein L596_002575 [Steinernema carpocapsae]|uniref:Uncharacterized protein n=1 Tax=Steinernema carpocapsae TaxID=34508 RepID=A0A4U8UPL4_STECR|nr:hypothetical protein L596_002575 [Steinernema carpocapsae]